MKGVNYHVWFNDKIKRKVLSVDATIDNNCSRAFKFDHFNFRSRVNHVLLAGKLAVDKDTKVFVEPFWEFLTEHFLDLLLCGILQVVQ